MTNRPVNFSDPTGHVQACEFGDEGDCGRGATTEEIYEYFTQDEKIKDNQWKVSWAEYYATLHEVSLSTEKYRQDVNKTNLNILDADIKAAIKARAIAVLRTPQRLYTFKLEEHPKILGGGYGTGDTSLGSEEGAGAGGVNPGSPGPLPQFKTSPRRPPFGPTPIPRRNGGEFIDLIKEI